MTDTLSVAGSKEPGVEAEIARLNKIIKVLMDRAERSTNAQASDFSLFQTAVMLEEQVRVRTAELEKALSENEKINRALRESEAKFRIVVNQSLVGIGIITHGALSYTNAKFNEIFGYSADEIKGQNLLDHIVESERALFVESMLKGLSGELTKFEYVLHCLRKDGTVIDIDLHGSATEIGGKPALIGMIMDVTERARAEREVRALQEKLLEQSTHDPLTGLYNRRYLDTSLARELILAGREGRPISLVMGDLDHFKSVNDRYGHLAGDEVLRVFGGLMKKSARGSDIYCRYGGEEFLLVLPGMAEAAAVERAEQLRLAMAATPVCFGSSQIAVTASFGIAVHPDHGRTGDELTAADDSALYAAKAAGRNRVSVCRNQAIQGVGAPVAPRALRGRLEGQGTTD